ncbi:unnamed protein product [Ranitomeya imitator]|uniref:Uncharacterized protein n=1 Tax=Ranitomeya imitator TaxID=111125 RepID=A0ABN9LYA5_9NEOB|nr:unnamed protein product [Ranitomeya imitator]
MAAVMSILHFRGVISLPYLGDLLIKGYLERWWPRWKRFPLRNCTFVLYNMPFWQLGTETLSPSTEELKELSTLWTWSELCEGDKGSALYVSPEHVSKTSKLSGLKLNLTNLFLAGESYSSDPHCYSDPSAPPNSPTELSSQQPTSPHIPPPPHLSSSNSSAPSSTTGLSFHTPPSKATVCATSGAHRGSHLRESSPSLPKVNPPPPPLSACSHPCNGHCSGTNALQGNSPGTTNRDTTCRGHKCSNVSNCLATQPCEADEGLGEDEDSGSERSSCTSSSTNQRDGKFCDCCYCEFFGHNTRKTATKTHTQQVHIASTGPSERPSAHVFHNLHRIRHFNVLTDPVQIWKTEV